MDKQLIFSEIESIMFDLETLIKSLANSREYIAGEDFSRASGKLSELEIELQSLAGRVAILNQTFDGKVVTSDILTVTLSPDSYIVFGRDLALKISPLLLLKDIT